MAKEKDTQVEATDGAKELAEATGVQLQDVAGTGAEGRITKADVEKAVENKAESGPPENKAADPGPKLATTEQGEEQRAEAEESSLKKADTKRYDALAQSGYRIPKSWAADAERRQKRDEAIAKNLPSTRPDKE